MNEYGLTEAEMYVLDQRLRGKQFRLIASEMRLHIGTVGRYMYDAQVKLGAKNFRGARRKWAKWRVTNVEWYTPDQNPRAGIKHPLNRPVVALST